MSPSLLGQHNDLCSCKFYLFKWTAIDWRFVSPKNQCWNSNNWSDGWGMKTMFSWMELVSWYKKLRKLTGHWKKAPSTNPEKRHSLDNKYAGGTLILNVPVSRMIRLILWSSQFMVELFLGIHVLLALGPSTDAKVPDVQDPCTKRHSVCI